MSINSLPDSTHPLIRQVAATLDRLGFARRAPRPVPLVIGVSGGADSVCLLHLLAGLAAERGLALHVAHLDHGLRPDAHDDALFVAELAQRLGVPFHQERLEPGALAGQAGGVEQAARTLRYRLFIRIAHNVTPADGVPTVALAHQADDQAETVIMHLARGSGLRGMGAMRLATMVDSRRFAAELDTVTPPLSMRVIRPLLTVPRAAVLRYLADYNLTWREDTTNSDPTYRRNHVRHTIIPALAELNPQIVATLARSAELLAAEWERIARLDGRALTALLVDPSSVEAITLDLHAVESTPRLVLDLHAFNHLEQAARRSVLRTALQLMQQSTATEISFTAVEQILDGAALGQAGGPHPVADDLCWSTIGAGPTQPTPLLALHRTSVLPYRPAHPLLPVGFATTPLPEVGTVQVTDTWTLHSELTVRAAAPTDLSSLSRWNGVFDPTRLKHPLLTAAAPGMRFAPAGLAGHHKSLGDFFTDNKVHATLRSRWPVIIDSTDGCVRWVCGLRTAHDSTIMSTTGSVRHLWWECATGDQKLGNDH